MHAYPGQHQERVYIEAGPGASGKTTESPAEWESRAPGRLLTAHPEPLTQAVRNWRTALVEATQAAARTKHTYLAAQYRRLAARRGAKRAVVAGALTLLVIFYTLLTHQAAYHELGSQYFDERDRQAVQHRLVRRLEALGYAVSLQPTSPAA